MDGLKRYLDETEGKPLQNVWTDVPRIGNTSSERIGYPTQKPLALLERIVKTSSHEGDVVLDPFCGCATACVAAENLGRRWIGIDISPKAVELVNMRLQQSMGDLLQSVGDGPYRHPQALRHRRASAVPPEQARPVRPAGETVQRLPQRVPVPRPGG